MNTGKVPAAIALCLVLLLTRATTTDGALAAQGGAAAADVALTGTVTSTEEGQMEGVLVSAKREGSTITTTVVSNAAGVYSFPRARLEPGRYNISIRAVGYALPGTSAKKPVDIAAGGAAEPGRNPARAQYPQLPPQRDR